MAKEKQKEDKLTIIRDTFGKLQNYQPELEEAEMLGAAESLNNENIRQQWEVLKPLIEAYKNEEVEKAKGEMQELINLRDWERKSNENIVEGIWNDEPDCEIKQARLKELNLKYLNSNKD